MRRRLLCLVVPVLLLLLVFAPMLVLASAALALHEELVRSGYAVRCLGKTCLFISSGDASLWWST